VVEEDVDLEWAPKGSGQWSFEAIVALDPRTRIEVIFLVN
jgi:hypothetical protein